MTKPISASEQGLKPHFKVRIVFPGVVIHVASWDEPKSTYYGWDATWINDSNYGDIIGSIDWSVVAAITWRWSE